MRIYFSARDLGTITLAPGPSVWWEILLSLHVLQHSEGQALFARWRRAVRSAIPDGRLKLLTELAPTSGYSPDFLTPDDPVADFEGSLDKILSTPRTELRRQLDLLAERRPRSRWIHNLGSGDAVAIRQLGETLRHYHKVAIQPYWSSIGTHVEAGFDRHRRQLASHGVDYMLANLHPRTRWDAPVLQLLDLSDRDLFLEGRGIRLQLSMFCWRLPTKLQNPALRPTLILPLDLAPGALRMAPGGPPPDFVYSLLGSTRAAVLAAAVDCGTTSAIARRCGVSIATVSHHTAVLRAAGLIISRRHGRLVFHHITNLGLNLLAGMCDE